MRNRNNSGNLLVGIAIGAISGAALGVLFAPSEGRKTRKKIADDVNKFSSDVMDKVNAEAEQLKNKANKLMHSSEQKAEEVKSQAKDKADQASKTANKVKEDAKAEAKDTEEIAAKANKRGDA